METQDQGYRIRIEGQPLLRDGSRRWFDVYYDLPSAGVNEQTGMVLICGGYGSKINSNIYRKLRRLLKDLYNLITVQCDFFGYTYMNNDFIFDESIPLESPESYNEMGAIQAMDHLCAVWEIMKIMSEEGKEFDKNKIFFYGHSHGAYLGYLCNAFAPGLFSAIIENSAYLYPYHIEHPRKIPYLNEKGEETSLSYPYLISEIIDDKDIYDLKYLYRRVRNEAKIFSFHGEEDTMIPLQEKQDFLQTVNNSYLHIVTAKHVDHCIFYSAKHSLDADFLRLFDYVVERHAILTAWGNRGRFSELKYRTPRYRYVIELVDGKPVMKRESYRKEPAVN